MTYAEAVREFKRQYWQDLLTRCQGRVGQAAKLAKVNRTSLYQIIWRLGVNVPRRKWRGNWGNLK